MDEKTMYAALFASALANGGSSGFYPTETQLAAMNSGITAEDVTQIGTNETNISLLAGHFTFSANSGHYYLQPEQPESPADGDIWIG